MKIHRQTHRRRVQDHEVRAILRAQMHAGLPTDAATVRALGIACGSCRLSRLRREVECELESAIPKTDVITPSAANGAPGDRLPAARPNESRADRRKESSPSGGAMPAPHAPTASARLSGLWRACFRRLLSWRWWQSPRGAKKEATPASLYH
jgi:hypothetical protein